MPALCHECNSPAGLCQLKIS